MKTKEQLRKELQKAREKIERGEQELKQLDKEEEVIFVPANIQFEKYCGGGDKLGLVFDEDRKMYTQDNGLMVDEIHPRYFCTYGELQLVKVDKPKAGNWYYAADGDNPDFSNKNRYKKYVSDKEYYYVSVRDIMYTNSSWRNYWQVVRVNDDS